eukprot:jgi/Ulvmu1/3471/UM016_0091.1
MTLLVQTDGRVKQRKARRKAAREKLLNSAIEAALDAAFAEVERLQTPLINVTVSGAAYAPAAQPSSGGSPSDGAGPARVPFHAPALAPDAAAAPMIFSDDRTRAMLDQATAQMHTYYREEFRQVLRGMAGRLAVQMEEKDEEDLVPDGVLEKLRRLVPAEFLVAWAVWTAAVDMVGPDKINETVQWVVWALYGTASYVYVLLLLLHGRRQEECKDFRAEARMPAVRAAVGAGAHAPAAPGAAVTAATRGVYVHAARDGPPGPEGAVEAVSAAGDRRTGVVVSWQREGERVAKRMPGSPSTGWLAVQAMASALAFLLISAATGDVYLRKEALMWTLMAVTPLFALFSQFVLPDGIVSTADADA